MAKVHRWELLSAAACIAIALYSLVYPIYRAFFRIEISYNEGWNVYNAWMVAHHIPLYGSPVGWTTVNYPGLSFFLIAQLSRLTHDFLFTGRALSLVGLAVSGVMVGLIVKRLTGARIPALLAGFYCIALFCSCGDFYVGADDPQLLAQAVFLSGLLLYVLRRDSDIALVGVAFLFAVGGSIKHNQIDFPLAVLLDLCLISRRRGRKFALLLVALGLVSIFANTWFGGPYFLTRLLTPRLYSAMHILDQAHDYYLPLLIPSVAACVTAFKVSRDRNSRVLALFFVISFLLGLFFSGGTGVSINAYFSNTVAIALLLGLAFDKLPKMELPWPSIAPHWKAAIPFVFFLWLLIPLQCNDILFLQDNLRKVHEESTRVMTQVNVLRAQPGPVLCESLLRCYWAGKPYIYDPFNSTSLINAGKLDADTVVSGVRRQEYGAIQFRNPPSANGEPRATAERFVQQILKATGNNYQAVLVNKGCTIYLPKNPTNLARAARSTGNTNTLAARVLQSSDKPAPADATQMQ